MMGMIIWGELQRYLTYGEVEQAGQARGLFMIFTLLQGLRM